MQERLTPIIVDAPQLSEEWFRARVGNVTGSKVALTMSYDTRGIASKLKMAQEVYELNPALYDAEYLEQLAGYPVEYCLKADIELKPNSGRELYKRQIVSERFTGASADEGMFISKAMLWGQMQERYAKAQYKGISGNVLQDAPLMLHPTWLCGASPDGLVIDTQTGELGNLEAKCLEPWNHLYKVIKSDEMPSEYVPQVQMQMWINGRDWCDFVGYDPRVQEGLRVYIKRIPRDEFYINEILVPSIERFLDECDADERQFYAIKEARFKKAQEKLAKQIKQGLVTV